MIRRLRRPSVEALEGRALMSFGGSPDVTFGEAGHVQVSFGAGTSDVAAQAAQPDGKIVVVGDFFIEDLATQPTTLTSSVSVARLNPDGSLDATFGIGGVANLFTNMEISTTGANSVAIQPDGKIVFGTVVNNNSEIVRLDADGTIDASFGTKGVAALPMNSAGTGTLGVSGVAVAPDGSIVVSGTEFNQSNETASFDLIKYTAAGSIDPTFGTAGVASTRFISTTLNDFPTRSSGLLVQADGKVDFTGTILPSVQQSGDSYANAGTAVLQLDADGSPDSTFGSAGYGQFSTSFGGLTDVEEIASGLALAPDGKLVIGGYAVLPTSGNNQFFAARLDANGTPDPTFGVGGTGIAPVGLQGPTFASSVIADAVAVDSFGRVLIGGSTFGAAGIARLTPLGQPDASFGQGGSASLLIPGATNIGGFVGLAPLDNGEVLASTTSGYVFKLRTAGASGDFDDDGISDPAVYLPNQGVFAYRPSSGRPDVIVPFGAGGAGQTIPAPGNYDGSGQTELGVYLATQGSFAYRPSGGGADVITPFGIAGVGQTIPAVGYYDGSGRQNIAAYLPSLGVYAIRPFAKFNGPASDEIIPFGIAGAGQSIPVPGDYEGTGVDDIAVYLPSIGSYAIRPSSGGPDKIIPFGIAGMGQSIPMPGDYDGSGKTELAVYLPSLGDFAYRPANGGPDVIVQFGLAGAGKTVPAPGDYTGSGHDELGVYLPSLGLYAYRPGYPAAPTLPDVVEPFGPPGAGQTIPFIGVPASDTLPTTVSAASAEIPLTADDLSNTTGPRKSKTGLLGA